MATELTQKQNYHAQTNIKATFSKIDGSAQKDYEFHSIKQLGTFLRSNQIPKDWMMAVEDQNLRHMDARGADLSSVSFTNCCLDNVAMDGAKIDYMSIEGGSARGISMRETHGEGITLSNVEMPGTRTEGAQWSNGLVENSNMANSTVDQATTFDSVGFSGSQVPREIIGMIPEGQAKTPPAEIRRPQARTSPAMAG